jgi:hypothetical protein
VKLAAIDPGANGAIACYNDGSVSVLRLAKLESQRSLSRVIGSLHAQGFRRAYLEHQSGAGSTKAGSTSMFRFGTSYGILIGAMYAYNWEIVFVTPQTWMKWLNIGSSSMSQTNKLAENERSKAKGRLKTEWKNRLKQYAGKIYPSYTPTLADTDALLLLHYALGAKGEGQAKG